MNILIHYATTHSSTEKIVIKMAELLNAKVDIVNVTQFENMNKIIQNDLTIFVSPTYGDAELHIDMEKFLTNFILQLKGKQCLICETGNYDGYNSLFGSSLIMKHHLDLTGCSYFGPSLSLDTLPKIDWSHLEQWCEMLNNLMQKHTTM